MATHLIYLPPSEGDLKPETDFKVLADRKSYFALVVQPLWLMFHRLWLCFGAYLVLMVAASLFLAWRPATPAPWLLSIPGLYFWLEGPRHLAARLERKGWRFAGVVDADDKEAAAVKWIARDTNEQEAGLPLVRKPRESAKRLSAQTLPAGLFPE